MIFFDRMDIAGFAIEMAVFAGISFIPPLRAALAARSLLGLAGRGGLLYGVYRTAKAALREASGGARYDLIDDSILPIVTMIAAGLALRGVVKAGTAAVKRVGKLKVAEKGIEKAASPRWPLIKLITTPLGNSPRSQSYGSSC